MRQRGHPSLYGHDRSLVLGSQFAQKQALAATDDSRTAHAVNASVWPGLRNILFTSSRCATSIAITWRAYSSRRTSLWGSRSSNEMAVFTSPSKISRPTLSLFSHH